MLLVWETFGYPDSLLATADDLVDAQYADPEDRDRSSMLSSRRQ